MKIITTLAVTLLLSGCSMFGNKGNALPPTPLKAIKASLGVSSLWKKNVGSSSKRAYIKIHPYIDGNTIYAAGGSSVTALNKATGGVLWKTAIGGEITGGVNGGNGMVFVGTSDGTAVALDKATGKTRWAEHLNSEILAVSSAASNMVVFRTSDGKLSGLSDSTGEIIWQQQRKTPILSLRGTSTPIVIGNMLIAGFDDGKVASYDMQAGHGIWESILAVPRGRTELDRIVDIDGRIKPVGEILFAASNNGQIAAINMRSGAMQWSQPYSTSTGVDANSNAIFTSDVDGTVWSLQAQSGNPIWKMTDLERRIPTTPSIVGSHIVIGDYQGYLHWITADTGQIVARTRVGNSGFTVPPLVEGNTVYVLDKSGNLSAQRK